MQMEIRSLRGYSVIQPSPTRPLVSAAFAVRCVGTWTWRCPSWCASPNAYPRALTCSSSMPSITRCSAAEAILISLTNLEWIYPAQVHLVFPATSSTRRATFRWGCGSTSRLQHQCWDLRGAGTQARPLFLDEAVEVDSRDFYDGEEILGSFGGKLTRDPRPNLTRRQFLRSSLIAGGTLLAGFDKLGALDAHIPGGNAEFEGGQQLGTLDFVGESRAPLDTLLGSELDGRLFSDLTNLTPENPTPPTEGFYVRTCASKLLEAEKGWQIKLGGLVDKPVVLTIEDLKKSVRPHGLHLMESSRDARATRLGMLSVANWSGALLSEVCHASKAKPQATGVMVSGFDRYPGVSATSSPGADWIFP